MCASKRTGKENFVTCMRHTLATRYGDQPVGMGGVFVIEKGEAKIHVMVRKYTNSASCNKSFEWSAYFLWFTLQTHGGAGRLKPFSFSNYSMLNLTVDSW